jgi:hypothetical protein
MKCATLGAHYASNIKGEWTLRETRLFLASQGESWRLASVFKGCSLRMRGVDKPLAASWLRARPSHGCGHEHWQQARRIVSVELSEVDGEVCETGAQGCCRACAGR